MKQLLSIFLALFLVLTVGIAQQKEQWTPLFDGKTLNGWKTLGGTAQFHVENGEIVGKTTTTPGERINTFLCTEKEYGNFILEFEFKSDEGMNSGVQFRSYFSDGYVRGYQYEIDPARVAHAPDAFKPANRDAQGNIVEGEPRNWTAGIYEERRRLWIYDLTDNPAARAAFKPDEWNKGRIEAYKDGIRTYINGVLAANLVDFELPNGFIGLQAHWLPEYAPLEVRFRNVNIQDFGLNDPNAAEISDKFIGEWKDEKSGVIAQSYKDNGAYRLQVRKEGYLNVMPTAILDGNVDKNNITYGNSDGWDAKFERNDLLITGPDNFSFKGKRANRRPPTLGAVPPTNAIVLFDGKDLSQWCAVAFKEWFDCGFEANEKAELTPAGSIRVIPDNGSLVSKQQFGDIKHLHLEFRLLGEPTNGGIYMMSRWEFNIKDSWCQLRGAPNGAFGNVEDVPVADYNRALPPMAWQTMDIEMKAPILDAAGNVIENARLTMYLNGELMYNDVEVSKTKGAGGGKMPVRAIGPIYLQEHGTSYEFRNIWIVEK
ncbi:MAG: DUF1080 domain-containing protein [Bacteroidales bacterium]|nr:DUF1080 domain-containing protein [Bacteroidales bacterium]MCL2133343.1 DUF1080 domain-containing protein [Bacteroidales bacterium]